MANGAQSGLAERLGGAGACRPIRLAGGQAHVRRRITMKMMIRLAGVAGWTARGHGSSWSGGRELDAVRIV